MGRLFRWTVGAVASALLAVGLPAVSMPVAAGVAASGVHVQPVGDGAWRGTAAPSPSPFSWRSPKGKNTPLVKSDPRAKRVKELTERRTQNASFFQMSDGSVQEVLSAVPVHYRDSRGVWQGIDPSVKPVHHAGFTVGSVGNSFQTFFGSTASSLVRVEQGTESIQVGLDGAHVGAPLVSGDTVSYPRALPGADLSYQSGPDGLVEKIVLAKPLAAGAVFAFTAKVSGFTPKQLPGGAIAFYGSESNSPLFTIPAPYMADSKRDANSPYGFVYSSRVTQSMLWDAKTGILNLRVTPDASWLSSPARVYPVTIDPTIVVSSTSSTAANVMILKDGPSTNYDTSWRLSVGTTTTGAARSLIKFVLPTVPAATVLTSADLQLFYDQTFTTGSNNVPMQALAANAAWDPTTATWNNASTIGGPVAGSTQMTANQLGVWNDFPVTTTVQSWLNGTLANNGFVLKASNESTLGQGGPRYEGAGYYYNGEVKNYPKLVIDYGVPGVTVNPPTVIHSTGAELSWPAYTNNTGSSANDIAEYQVHRSIYQTFTPTASTEISPVTATTTSFVDSTAVPTPANNSDPYGNAYYYMVVVKTKSGQLIPGPTTVVRLPEAGRTTLLIPTQSTTTLSSTEPTTVLNTLSNAGTPQPWLEVGDNSPTYGTARSILNFPSLSAIPPGSTILDAHLKLWQETTTTTSSGAVYELHALTHAFTGSQATWNAAATGTNWTTAGGSYNATKDGTVSSLTNDPNRQNFDATSIVQGWVNSPSTDDGLLIKLAAETASSPQERTIFAGPNTAEPALRPTLVITYLDTSTGSTYYAPSTPTDMNPGTTYSVPVTLNNTTAGIWSASSEVLTYHWLLPDGTDITAPGNQLQTPLSNDMAPAATATLNAQVTSPTPTDGNRAEDATLAWDMYNKTTGTYLSGATTAAASSAPMSPGAMVRARQAVASGGGTGSLTQQVSVDATGNNQLGLETFYPYATVPTGSGGTLYANTASGNTVWNDDLFSNPSAGFDTTLRLSYNSLSTMDVGTGFGWSIEASAPIRLGQALQFHPPSNPTSVVMVDGTGNAHQWTLNTTTNTWTSPPGVHLFLQQLDTGCGPKDSNAQAWKMTRPDRTTYFFDCEGYPTAQVDANNNEAAFTYSAKQSQNKPEEFLQYITDPVARQTLTLSYYNAGDATYSYIDSTGALAPGTNLTDPAIIDHLKSITDVSGRTVDFYYTTQGLLGRIVDGANAPTTTAKTFKFSYDATQGMKNVKLVAVRDPLGNTTNVAYYPDSSPTKWWTQSITDRLGHATSFAYAQPGVVTGAVNETTVTDANGGITVTDTDSAGRMLRQTDPLKHKTTLAWDTDNNVSTLIEDNGAQTQWTYDPATGYPLTQTDALAVKNGTASTVYTYETADSADPTLSGHIALLTDQTSAAGRRTHYTYYPMSPSDPGYVSTPGYAGNLQSVQAPDGTAAGAPANSYLTTYTYDALGEVASVKDANGNTTTYSYTKNIGPGSEQINEPTGQPLDITDALGNTTTFVYGPRGEVLSITDPLARTSTASFDVFLRPLSSTVPKDQANNVYITTPAPLYDSNDNITQQTAPNGAVVTAVFNADDQLISRTVPPDTSTSPTRTETYTYDKVGNLLTSTEPLGNVAGAVAGSYTTVTAYDADNEPTKVTDATNDITSYTYDDVDNKIKVADPLGNVTQAAYDLDHRTTGTTDAMGGTTSVGYDPDGLVLSSTNQDNATTLYTLDSNGHATQVQVPHTQTSGVISYDTTQYTFDQVGNNTSVISPRGVASGIAGAYTTQTKYDADNRKIAAIGAALPGDPLYFPGSNPEIDYTYDAAGEVAKITQDSLATPASTSYTYYDNGWTKSSTDPFSVVTKYDYNPLGQESLRTVTSSDETATRTQTWGYYPDGTLQSHTDTGVPNGWASAMVNAASPTTSSTGGNNWTRSSSGTGYQGAGYYETHPAGAGSDAFTWNLAVPQDGNYTVYVEYPQVAGASNAAAYAVNYSGGTVTVPIDQTSNQGTWVAIGTFPFTQAGTGQSVTLTQSAAGVVSADAVEIVRDDSGNTRPNPTSVTYTYDANGNGIETKDASPNAQFNDYTATFDQLNRTTQLQEKTSGTVMHTIGYNYDADSNVLTRTNDQAVDTFTYDQLNLPSTVLNTKSSTDVGDTTDYTYTPTGQIATQGKANGDVVSNAYNMDGTLNTTAEVNSATVTVDSHQYTYDPNNNITEDVSSIQNADTPSTFLNHKNDYTYTPNNQVASVTTDSTETQSYAYDRSGNITNELANGQNSEFIYDRNRLTTVQVPTGLDTIGIGGSYQYDDFGRLNTVTGGSGLGTQRYTYDGFDNVTQESKTATSSSPANATSFTYDSLNRPLTETMSGGPSQETASFTYLGTSQAVVDEADAAGASSTDKVYQYSPTGMRLYMIDTLGPAGGTPQTYDYSYNQHSDTELITGSTGTAVATYGYTAYGVDNTTPGNDTGLDKPSSSTTTPPTIPFNSYRFNSARVDTTTDNYNMAFRTYAPGINRFLTTDSYNGSAADAAMAADPNNANRYGFVGGNPISNVELNGHDWKSILGIGLGVAAAVGATICVAATDGLCLIPIAEATTEASVYGAGAAVTAGATTAIIEGGSALGIGAASGGIAASAVALSESAGEDVGAADAAAADSEAGAADTAAQEGPSCPQVGGESFTADTKVQLANGSTKVISQLKAGDEVKSTNTATGKTTDSKTSAVLVNHDTDLYNLTVHTAKGNQVVHTTAHHKFFDRTTKSWVEAAKLHKGDLLTTNGGSTVTVVGGTTPANATGYMWDLTVPGDHDFYVVAGDTPVLVHNISPSCYTSVFRMKLDPADFGKSRPTHFRRANAALLDAIRGDADLKQYLEGLLGPNLERQLTDFPARAPRGWVWNHALTSQADGVAGVMELVPLSEHTPGSPWWRVLHPGVYGGGGYSEWAIPAGAPKN